MLKHNKTHLSEVKRRDGKKEHEELCTFSKKKQETTPFLKPKEDIHLWNSFFARRAAPLPDEARLLNLESELKKRVVGQEDPRLGSLVGGCGRSKRRRGYVAVSQKENHKGLRDHRFLFIFPFTNRFF